MSSKLSVEEVLANLEQRAVFHREQEALHAQKEAHHREEREQHAAALAKVLHSLEAFRTVAAAAVDLAQPVAAQSGRVSKAEEENLPEPGRLMVGRLIHRVVVAMDGPFGATAVAAEVTRRFADRLREPVGPRTASDVLRRLLAEGEIRLVRKGKAFHEAMYTRR